MEKTNAPLYSALSHRVGFFRNIASEESEKEIWKEEFSSFVSINPLSAQGTEMPESLDFGSLSGARIYIFKSRFLKNISSGLRIVFKGRNFEIKRVINEGEKDKILKMLCAEV